MFKAYLGGSEYSRGPTANVDTAAEALAWAKEYGDTVDVCIVTDGEDREVARFIRDKHGDGRSWLDKASLEARNPKGAGRKSLGLSHSFSVQVTAEQLTWLESQRKQTETRSVVIRRLIDNAMGLVER